MWDPPRPGLEPVSPALAGRLSTTVPPGKPSACVFISSAFPDIYIFSPHGSTSCLGTQADFPVFLLIKSVVLYLYSLYAVEGKSEMPNVGPNSL